MEISIKPLRKTFSLLEREYLLHPELYMSRNVIDALFFYRVGRSLLHQI